MKNRKLYKSQVEMKMSRDIYFHIRKTKNKKLRGDKGYYIMTGWSIQQEAIIYNKYTIYTVLNHSHIKQMLLDLKEDKTSNIVTIENFNIWFCQWTDHKA